MPVAYYNEVDPFAAAWLRNLIAAGLIAWGDVDERSIEDVSPDDLRRYGQHHFFAGIGVWSAALRAAGWDDDRPVWTGSCPCQPFSAAGKGGGFADERHLWPSWFWLIRELRPGVVFGEQVASPDGLKWFDLVSSDLEGEAYAVGSHDLCAAGVGAPHIRQRLFFVAHHHVGRHRRAAIEQDRRPEFASGGSGERLAHHHQCGQSERPERDSGTLTGSDRQAPQWDDPGGCSHASPVVDAAGEQAGLPGCTWEPGGAGDRLADTLEERRPGVGPQRDTSHGAATTASGRSSAWSEADWIPCRDGKWRPVEPGTFPLVVGAPARVGRLRGYGNAIVLPVAQAFIEAAMTVLP